MQNFKSKIKSLFKSDTGPKYKAYQQSDLRTVTMKTRIVFDQHRNKLLQKIKNEDARLRKTFMLLQPQILAKIETYQTIDQVFNAYQILQQITENIIEAQSIVILKEMVKRIEDGRISIIKTDGDMAKLKNQTNWFRAALWYRKLRQIKYIDQLHQFCFNFFKGVDITSEMEVNCQLFRLYPMLGLLSTPKDKLPLRDLYNQIKHTLGWQIDQNVLDYVIKKGAQQKTIRTANSKLGNKSVINNNPYENVSKSSINGSSNLQNKIRNSNLNENEAQNPQSYIRQPKINPNNNQNQQNLNLGTKNIESNQPTNNYKNQQPSLKKSVSEGNPYQGWNNNVQTQKKTSIPNYYNPHPESSYSINNKKDQDLQKIDKLKESTEIKYDNQHNQNMQSTIGLISKPVREQLQYQAWGDTNRTLQYKMANQTKDEKMEQIKADAIESPKKPVSMSNLFSRKKSITQNKAGQIQARKQEKIETAQQILKRIDENNQKNEEQDLLQSLQKIAQSNKNLENLDLLNSHVPLFQQQNLDEASNHQNFLENEPSQYIQQEQNLKQAQSDYLKAAGQLKASEEQMQICFKQITQACNPLFIPDTGSRIMRSSFNNFNQDPSDYNSLQLESLGKEELLNIELQQSINFQDQKHQYLSQPDDERESINIIRNHIRLQNDKKFVKKPYMVSIYARKQLIDSANKANKAN